MNDTKITDEDIQALRDLFNEPEILDQAAIDKQIYDKFQNAMTCIEENKLDEVYCFIEHLDSQKTSIDQITSFYVFCKEKKLIKMQINVMAKIIEKNPKFEDVLEQITNCYEIYMHQVAFNTIQRNINKFNQQQNTWLLMELADYLLFFKRQYSKAFLLYEQIKQDKLEDNILSLNIEIGMNIAKYLSTKKQEQIIFNNGLHLLELVKNVDSTIRQKSYLNIKLGKLFYNLSKPMLALQCLHTAYKTDSTYLRPLFMLISILQCQGRINLAKPLLKKAPINHYKTYHYYGISAQACDAHKEAVSFFSKSIELNQQYMKNYILIGDSYLKLLQFQTALESYHQALDLDSSVVQTLMKIINMNSMLCIYLDQKNDENKVILALDNFIHRTVNQQASINVMKPINQPPMEFKSYYLFNINPELLHSLGKIQQILNHRKNQMIVDQESNKIVPFTFNHFQNQYKKKNIKSQIKIGFILQEHFDGGFLQIFAEFFKSFDNQKIQVHIYSIEKQQYTQYFQQDFVNSSVNYTCIYQENPVKAAQLIYSQQINILINMNVPGSIACQICELKPAPIQVLFYNCPGSSGMKQYDYIIGDKIVCPIQNHYFYTEQIIMMPKCFTIASHNLIFDQYITDDERNEFQKEITYNKIIEYVPDIITGKVDVKIQNQTEDKYHPSSFPIGKKNMKKYYNIPQDAFLFGTFSQFYKFDIKFLQMIIDLLQKCKNAYFVCLESPQEAVLHVKQFVESQNYELTRRIVFLPYLDNQLAAVRLRRSFMVDVLFDTVRLSGNYMIQDALFVGTLVICQQRDYIGTRIASSLLVQVGLQDLICQNYPHMLDKSVQLYNNKEVFISYKQILHQNYKTIFNLKEYVGYFTQAMQDIHSNWCEGLDPVSFEVNSNLLAKYDCK